MSSFIDDDMAELNRKSTPQPDVVVPDVVTFLKSRKEGKIVVYQSYMYMKNHEMKTRRVYYNCREKQAGCRGSVTLDVDGTVYGTNLALSFWFNLKLAAPRIIYKIIFQHFQLCLLVALDNPLFSSNWFAYTAS